jgi:RHS repeat-associated protein
VLQFSGTSAANLSHRYLWGPSVDQLLADERVTSPGSPGSVLWPLADHLGTIRDLAMHTTGGSTTIVNHRRYDTYGNLFSESNAAVDEIFSFTGRQFDEATGLQYNLNRWYDPKTGRWISEDPIGFAAGDTNLSRYVGNSPTNFIDPSGLKKYGWHNWEDIFGDVLRAAADYLFEGFDLDVKSNAQRVDHNFESRNPPENKGMRSGQGNHVSDSSRP